MKLPKKPVVKKYIIRWRCRVCDHHFGDGLQYGPCQRCGHYGGSKHRTYQKIVCVYARVGGRETGPIVTHDHRR